MFFFLWFLSVLNWVFERKLILIWFEWKMFWLPDYITAITVGCCPKIFVGWSVLAQFVRVQWINIFWIITLSLRSLISCVNCKQKWKETKRKLTHCLLLHSFYAHCTVIASWLWWIGLKRCNCIQFEHQWHKVFNTDIKFNIHLVWLCKSKSHHKKKAHRHTFDFRLGKPLVNINESEYL